MESFLDHNIAWLLPIIIFEAIIKPIALWKAARNNQLYWFIALAVVNSIGILPALYIFLFQQKRNK